MFSALSSLNLWQYSVSMTSLEEVELGVELGFDENGCLESPFSGMPVINLGSTVMLESSEIQIWL